MPQWKLFLIQLLISLVWARSSEPCRVHCGGPIVFLWITFGTIFAGGVHDFFSGMMSERNDGASISEVCGIYLGGLMQNVMRVFSVVLLVMVGTVFAVGPAGLIVTLFSNGGAQGLVVNKEMWLWIILAYYFIATFISIDKIIGKIYPIFGICLIIMALGVAFWYLHKTGICDPGDLEQFQKHASERNTGMELHVHHRCLRRDLRFPRNTVTSYGALYEI